jgi:hypothetical protein
MRHGLLMEPIMHNHTGSCTMIFYCFGLLLKTTGLSVRRLISFISQCPQLVEDLVNSLRRKFTEKDAVQNAELARLFWDGVLGFLWWIYSKSSTGRICFVCRTVRIET